MELGRILFETFFCTEQHDKTIQKFISLGIFLGPRHLFWESAEINAYRQVRHFFLPRGVCRYVIIVGFHHVKSQIMGLITMIIFLSMNNQNCTPE